jgi:hypothetical protein
MKGSLGSSLLALTLVACSTATGPLSAPPLPDNPAEAANVTVYRQTAGEDGALRMVFTIDDAATYQLRPGESYSFVMPAGTYGFGYRLGVGYLFHVFLSHCAHLSSHSE